MVSVGSNFLSDTALHHHFNKMHLKVICRISAILFRLQCVNSHDYVRNDVFIFCPLGAQYPYNTDPSLSWPQVCRLGLSTSFPGNGVWQEASWYFMTEIWGNWCPSHMNPSVKMQDTFESYNITFLQNTHCRYDISCSSRNLRHCRALSIYSNGALVAQSEESWGKNTLNIRIF